MVRRNWSLNGWNLVVGARTLPIVRLSVPEIPLLYIDPS